MSAEAAIAVRTWSAGRYTCRLSMQRLKPGALVSACIEWTPEIPHRLSDAEMAEYKTGRDAALADVSAALGVNAAVLEL